MEEHAVAFWLVPAEPWRSEFQARIEQLGCDQEAPYFEPHITLFVQDHGADLNARDWSALLAQLTAGCAPLRTEVERLGHTEALFKTLFLQLRPSLPLTRLHERARALFAQPDAYGFEPHLSLLYKQLPAAAREKLAAELPPLAAFDCDRVAVVTHGPAGWLDVESWREVCSAPLRASE